MSRRYRVALAGYYGFGNLGDELLLRASIEALERCGVGREAVVVLSNDPGGTSQDFDVDSVSRWSLREVRRALRESDTLLLGGGGLFQDGTSLRSCTWYCGLVRLARLCGARPWALGQSIGPLRRRAARRLTRWALGSCAVLHLRDAPSMAWARELGLRAAQGEDLALTLPFPAAEPREGGRRLLVNLRPCKDVERFVHIIAPCVKGFDGEKIGVALAEEDALVLLRFRRALGLSRFAVVRGMEDLAALWSGAEQAVGMRLHFALISALYGTPLAVLPYDPKVSAFAERAGAACIERRWTEPARPTPPVSRERAREEVDRLCRLALGM